MFSLLMGLLFSPVSMANSAKYGGVPPTFCQQAKEINSSTRGCMDNGKFIQAAQHCLELLQAWEEKVADTVKASYKNPVNAQAADFNAAKIGYGTSTAAWDYMSKVTQVALDDLGKYPEEVMLPSSYFFIGAAGNDPDAWAMSQDCYGQTKKSIAEVTSQVRAKLEKFQLAKQKSELAEQTSEKRTTGDSSLGNNQVVSGKSASAPLPATLGSSGRHGSSTVTGMIDDMQKQNAAPSSP
jgi:hypothetical protein